MFANCPTCPIIAPAHNCSPTPPKKRHEALFAQDLFAYILSDNFINDAPIKCIKRCI